MNHGERKPQTLARKRAAVSRLLGFLAAEGNREAFEALVILRHYKVAPPIRQVDRRVIEPISAERFSILRERADSRYRALFDILWWTGARISEILGDAVTGIPPLSGSDLLALVEQGYVRTQGKGGKWRVLVLPPKGRVILRGFAARLDGEMSERAFPLSPQAVNATLHRLGFDGGAHSFRHAYRMRLRQAMVSEEIQARLMGHGPKSVTDSYGAAGVEELLAVVESLP